MKNSDIIQMYNNLVSMRERAQVRFPARISFAITHNIKLLEPIAIAYDQTRLDVIKNYGEALNDGNYRISPEKIAEAEQELKALDDMEVGVTLSIISLDELEKFDLSLEDMNALYPMIG